MGWDSQRTGVEAGDFLELALRRVSLRRHRRDDTARFARHGNCQI